MSLQSIEQLKEENRVLKSELERLEELLVSSRAERDQIGIRYNAISERLEAVLKKEKGDVSLDEAGRQSLVQQNIELRRKLEEEHASYKRKLQFYQDGQTRQAQLVQKLQAKILQYKNRCLELEDQLHQLRLDPHKTTIKLLTTHENYETHIDRGDGKTQRQSLDHLDSSAAELDATVIQLEGEQNRVEHLTHINGLLREQLDRATAANKSAMADLHKLVHIRDELQAREEEWKKEEQTFNDYYEHTHNHLIELWQLICAFRRQFNDMKVASEHELAHLASEFHADTQNIVTQLRSRYDQNQGALEKERLERSGVEQRLADKVRELSDLRAKYEAQTADLNARNGDLVVQNERLRLQSHSSDKDRLTQKTADYEGPSSQQLTAKVDRLTDRNNLFEGLKHIAQDLLDNCDSIDSNLKTKGGDVSSKDLSFRTTDLSSVFHARSVSYSPLRGRARSPSPKSDETASLIKRALQRSRQLIVDLGSKISAYQTELHSMQTQLADFENDRKRVENLLRNLHEERDKLKNANEDLERELRHVKNLLDAANSEKERSNGDREKLVEKVDTTGIEILRLKSLVSDLQKQLEDSNVEKEDLRKDLERQIKEVEKCRRSLEQSEERFSRLKEDLVVTKEALNASQFRKDMVEHEKNEAEAALSRVESRKVELELELSRLRAEEINLKDALSRSQMQNETLLHEKNSLSQSLAFLESEKKSWTNKIADLDQSILRLRSDLSTAEREKAEAENEKTVSLHSLKLADKARRDLEEDLQRLKGEQNDHIDRFNALSRQKNSLLEELQEARKEVKRLLGGSDQSNAEREQLVKDRAEFVIKISSLEKVIHQQNEVLSGVRSERDAFEADFYQLQQLTSDFEKQKHGFEVEKKELLKNIEHFQASISQGKKDAELSLEKIKKLENIRSAIQQQLAQKDQDHAEKLRQERIRNEDSLKQLMHNLELKAVEHENELERLKQQFSSEKSELISIHDQQMNELNAEIENIQFDYDEQLIMIRNEKNQEFADSEREKGLLNEKLLSLQKELKELITVNEQEKRERMSQWEQQQMALESLQAENRSLRKQLDDFRARHEADLGELKSMNAAFDNLHHQRETLASEISELRSQLKRAEESRDALKHDLNALNCRLKEVEEARELSLSDISNLKRSLSQETFEKDAAQKAANDLRNLILKSEGKNVEQNRVIQELKQMISVLEEQKLGFERDTEELRVALNESEKKQLDLRRLGQDLHRQQQLLENERSQTIEESRSLRRQVALGKQNEEELRKENFVLKQKTTELEGHQESIAKEIALHNRRKKELEENFRHREKEFQQLLEETRLSEQSANGQTRDLEKILESANSTIARLRLQLSEAEGKAKGLEEELAYVENGKRGIEDKLNIVVSSLQRTIGLSPFGSRRSSVATRFRSRSPSPNRRGILTRTVQSHQRSMSSSRSRSVSPSLLKVSEIKPEVISSALQNLMQRFQQMETENNNSASVIRNLTSKLQDAEQGSQRSNNKVLQLQKALAEVEEVRHNLESSAQTIQSMKLAHEETERQRENDRRQMTDKINRLQISLTAAEQGNLVIQEIQEKLQDVKTKAELDKRTLRLNLEEAEGRLAKREVEFAGLEGEIQHLKQILGQKEAEYKSLSQSLSGDLEGRTRHVRDLEQKLRSLEEANNALRQIISKTEAELLFRKDELHSGNTLMQDRMAAVAGMQDRLVQLQRSLESSEHDRQQLQDRLEAARHGLNDLRKQNHALLEKIQELENQASSGELQKMELESQIKQSSLIVKKKEELEEELLEKIQKLQAEKIHLQECLNVLQRNQANLDKEKQMSAKSNKLLEQDIKTLEKNLELQILGKSKRCDECMNLDRRLRQLDEDNAELQRQLQALQGQLDRAEEDYEQRLADLTFNQRREKEAEIILIRTQAEKSLADHERSTRHRISSLEDQILMLRRELELEIRKRQQYISHGLASDDELKEISSGFDSDTRQSELDSLLERNNRKKYGLKESGGLNKALPTRHDISSPRPLVKPTSAGRVPLPLLMRLK